MNFVFVYGSLKKGFGNHRLLVESELICEAVTLDSKYNMRSCGGFPGVHSNGENRISGELYSVDDITFESLDRLEGNGHFYNREEVFLVSTSQPAMKPYKAWMYLLREDYPFSKDDLGRIDNSNDKLNCQKWINQVNAY